MDERFHRTHIYNKVVLVQTVIGTYVYSMIKEWKKTEGRKKKQRGKNDKMTKKNKGAGAEGGKT